MGFEIGMGESEFWDTSFYIFSMRLHAYRKQKEENYINDWERIRWLGSVLLQPHSKRTLRPRNLIIFPWELPDEVPTTIPEELLKLSEAMDAEAKKDGLI